MSSLGLNLPKKRRTTDWTTGAARNRERFSRAPVSGGFFDANPLPRKTRLCYHGWGISVRKGRWHLRVLGIDPGLATVGCGVVERASGDQLVCLHYEAFHTGPGADVGARLRQIYDAACAWIDRYSPDVLAVEKLFFNRNVTNAFAVGQARGVVVLAAVQRGLEVAEYTPLQVKQAVTGYGGADKRQVQEMVRLLLRLADRPRPDDAADALAVAVCHAHASMWTEKIREGSRP